MKVDSGQWAVDSFDLITAHYLLPTTHYDLRRMNA
jgi:hypothetical protein